MKRIFRILAFTFVASPTPTLAAELKPFVMLPDVGAGFEENRGQAPANVRFIWRGSYEAAHFTGDSIIYTPTRSPTRIQLLGANASARTHGAQQLPGLLNIIRGNDQSTWRTSVPRFSQIVFEDIYPGIDIMWERGTPSPCALPLTATVRAGAQAGVIQIAVTRPNSPRYARRQPTKL